MQATPAAPNTQIADPFNMSVLPSLFFFRRPPGGRGVLADQLLASQAACRFAGETRNLRN
jgi:hypothetical protein